MKKGSMKTSHDVLRLGLYVSICCGHERTFDKGEIFQRCHKCHGLCEWELMEQEEQEVDRNIAKHEAA